MALKRSPEFCLKGPGDPGAGPFWPQEHSLNKLGRGPLGNAINQISRL